MTDHHGSWTRAQAVDFLDASRAWAPRSLLMEAMEAIKAAGDERSVDADVLVTSSVASSKEARGAPHRRRAADLGCGAGTEVLELLRHGFEVLAVDLHAECIEETRRRASREGIDDRLETRVADLAGIGLSKDRFDLVHAGFALPFCPRSAWPACWTAIARSVRVGGVFAGQFFGPHEPMMLEAASADVTVLDREDVANLRRVVPGIVWEVLREEEIDRPGRGPRRESKHWHVFHVLWRRVA